ncbi:BLOC-2 complex member HPS5 [Anabrus simplex]|uniref:BLOC-2 complex member HPS5 n=1 Tax=Anabrus simplex TaxID=316456 RepID=UPI0035A36A5A
MGTDSFVLVNVNNLSSIFSPLKSTHRIKYTCFSVSQNFLILGATSGGLYVFKRDPCTFLQLLPNKEGAVTHVAISPDEKLFGFATIKGAVFILERNVGPGARLVQTSSEHLGTNISALQWNGHSSELYVGDDTGKVSVINISAFVTKSMFNTPSYQLMQLDSRIVQIDWQCDLLLVSTLTRSYLCDTLKEQYRQIGHRLREGEYGGCFYICGDHTLPALTHQRTEETRGGSFISLNDGEKLQGFDGFQNLKMYCARPGSRLWEVQADGTVLRTHQFKQALAVKPTSFINLQESSNSSQLSDNHSTNSTNNTKSDTSWSPQSFNFSKLLLLTNKYLFTFKKDGIYVFDPEKVSVVLWSNEIVDIVDAKVLSDMIYLRTGNGSIHALLFSSLEKFLIRLYLHKQYQLCAQLCEVHKKYLMDEAPTSTKLHLLADLGTKLSNDEVAERIFPLLQEISKYAQETKLAQRLDSGIFVVGNRHFLWQTENRSSLLPENKRSDQYKCRSLSASPETTRRRKKSGALKKTLSFQKSGSSSSLPELEKTSFLESSESTPSHGGEKPRVNEKSNNNGIEEISTETNSPEALQTWKELGQKITSGTKSLKEKWQVFEGKILGQETQPELLDVRKADYQENSTVNDMRNHRDDEVVYSENKTNLLSRDLDVSDATIICSQLREHKTDDTVEINQLVYKLFDSVMYIYEDFTAVSQLKRKEPVNRRTDASHQKSMSSFLTFKCSKPFPFQNYFPEDIIKVLCLQLHESLKTKVLVSWLQSKVDSVDDVKFNGQLIDIYSIEILKIDILLSQLLIVCSDLLDPQSILQCIVDSGVPCYYKSFCVVLDKYQEGAMQYVTSDRNVDNTCWKWPLPLLLNAMFCMLKMDQIETCCLMGSDIGFKNLYYLILRLEEHLLNSGDEQCKVKRHCSFLLLSYLDKIAERNSVLKGALEDEHLSKVLTVTYECVNDDLGQCCECGYPLPLSDVTVPQFTEIGEIISAHFWRTDHDRHIDLCRRTPVMWKFGISHRLAEEVGPVLPLIIQFGDISMLEKCLPSITQPLWEKMLCLISTVRSGKCLNCGTFFGSEKSFHGISISSVGKLMIKSLGPETTVNLLMKHAADIGPGELDVRFFQSCILSAIVEKHVGGLRSEVVDMINDDSRSSSKTSLFSSELGKALEASLLQDLGKKSVPLNSSSSKHHWGVCVDLEKSNCPCCMLPLNSEVLIKEGGLTIFHCGHSYHAVCLNQRHCHTCLLCSKGS